MNEFDALLRNFDLEFFGKGNHKISIEKTMDLLSSNKATVLDVRSREESSFVRFEFAINIPVSEIPDRLRELPRDKPVIIFCSSVVRAAIVYAYLQTKGYNEARILTAHLSDISGYLKPGFVLKEAKKGS